ncbi:MAG: hypothetical protein AAF517_09405 [Planctomycetota bacterium]
MHSTRRSFLQTTAAVAAGSALDLSFLNPLFAAAKDATVRPDLVQFGPEMDPLLRLFRKTPPERIVEVFVKELRGGLSYSRFVSTIFLAAVQTGDLHQMAQVFGAHRIGSEARIGERLLPLFWALSRVRHSHEKLEREIVVRPLRGAIPRASEADAAFGRAMLAFDGDGVERSAVALARARGARHAMRRLWEFSARDLGGSLGHLPIGVASSWRTLDAVGWKHAEGPLRYLAREIGRFDGDASYPGNLERVRKTVPSLAADWAADGPQRDVTLELYGLLRAGDSKAACDFMAKTLAEKRARAGALWDAVSLAAADHLFRYEIGGGEIGGAEIHIVTCTNALRFGFDLVEDSSTRLLMLLQGAGEICDFFFTRATESNKLRNKNLVEDLRAREGNASLDGVFSILPVKDDHYEQRDPSERLASDRASELAFQCSQDVDGREAFVSRARGLVCRKASADPHDLKFPAAIFEDAERVSAEWRPYLLAASVHALHGEQSADQPAFTKARAALKPAVTKEEPRRS